MTYQEIVEKVQNVYEGANASKVNEHVAIQVNITGEGEGAFYIEVAEGNLTVAPYEYFDRDVLVTTSGENIIAVADGSLDITKAYMTGKIKAEGNLGKALLLKNIELNKEAKPKKASAKKTTAKKTTAKAETKTTAAKTTKTAAKKTTTAKTATKTTAKKTTK